jgi:hypothetical protein
MSTWIFFACMRSLLLMAALALAGCASVTSADGQRMALTSEEFRAYVERVFREQNRLADELAFALEEPAADTARLAAAETDLLEACALLNALATARRDEQPLSLMQRARAARSAPRCERALTAARTALEG